jgi:O-antigen ligase
MPNFKLGLIIAILVISIYNRKFIAPKFWILFSGFLLILFPIVVGFSLNNQVDLMFGAFKLHYIFPMALYLMFLGFSTNSLFEIVLKSATVALFFGFFLNLSTFLFYLNFFPVNLNLLFYPDEDRIGFNEGFIHIINSSFSYWVFLVPLLYFSNYLDRKWANALWIGTFVLSVVSGRRVLLLPYILLLLSNFKKPRVIISISVILGLLSYYSTTLGVLDFDIIAGRFMDAVSGTGDSEARSEQHVYFWKYISDRPIFGYGLGAFMPDFLRNDIYKTAYENTYDYLFFERGILGILLYFFFIFLLFFKILKSDVLLGIRKPLLIATLVLMLASYTNPYWGSSFDYTVPFAVLMRFANVNYYDLRRNSYI